MWVAKNNWKDQGDGYVYVSSQEDSIKTKNITEKITFEGLNNNIIKLSWRFIIFKWKGVYLYYIQ